MTASTLPLAASAPVALAGALTAFLRSVERRGAVLAELLCGDPMRGDAALAVAMRAFRNASAQVAIAEWPLRFWGLLLAVPQLRETAPQRHWPTALSVLGRLGTGARAALLLRLVAGLEEADAAAVLGIALPTYRLALQHALPHHPDGHPDAAGWRALGAATQSMLRQLPAERLAHLARVRGMAIQEMATQHRKPGRAAVTSHTIDASRRWLWPALWAALAACVIAFAGSFWLPTMLRADDVPRIEVTPLPAADAPAATFDADTALLTHRDFEQLADAREDALVRGLDFYAWYATRATAQPGADGVPLLLPDAGALQPDAAAGPALEDSHGSR